MKMKNFRIKRIIEKLKILINKYYIYIFIYVNLTIYIYIYKQKKIFQSTNVI